MLMFEQTTLLINLKPGDLIFIWHTLALVLRVEFNHRTYTLQCVMADGQIERHNWPSTLRRRVEYRRYNAS